MSERLLPNWLIGYKEYTAKSEPPDSFNLWCGIAAIGSALRRRTWVNMGYFKLYPNLYIILVAPPGRCRKGVAINMFYDIVSQVKDISVCADAITREALIQLIASKQDTTEMLLDGKRKLYIHSSLTIVSKELSVFLGKQNTELLALLTELYDCHNKWEYKTKHSGSDYIVGEWLAMLGATTPEWLVGSIPITAIGGGFTSRVVFVVEDKKARSNPRPVLSPRELQVKQMLARDLEVISQLRGPYEWTKKTDTLHTAWYNQLDKNELINDTRFMGYVERKDAHVIKISQCLAAAESNEMIIHSRHMEMAIEALESLEPKMINAFGAVGRSDSAQDVERVLRQITNAERISYSAILSMNWRDTNVRELDIVLQTLQRMGSIDYERGKDQEVYYWAVKKKKK